MEIEKIIEQAKKEERERLKEEMLAGIKYGDLREGNLDNFINQVFK